MVETVIDMKQALQIARAFNLAFNNAVMYGGNHHSTEESTVSFFQALKPVLESSGMVTVSVERGSVFFESHCVDRQVSVPRIVSRFTKTGVHSVSFEPDISLKGLLALYHLLGGLSEFKNVEAMQGYLDVERISGLRLNYVLYQKVTADDAVVHRNALSEALGKGGPAEELIDLSEILSVNAAGEIVTPGAAHDSSGLSPDERKSFVAGRIKQLNAQLLSAGSSEGETAPTSGEMLQAIHKLKETVLEDINLQRETGKVAAADELVISEINRISYQVIVRLIKEEYRNDRKISVKRLAQIIRRMLPSIKELKYLLPQLKMSLFAEGMAPAEYLSLVKELSRELESDELMQVLVEASEQVGLTLNELIQGIRDAPEETARLIVLAAELKKGGIAADEQQMSEVLSEYIERVSRTLALQSPEAAAPGGGGLLGAAVTRIEREILDRLKSHTLAAETVSEVARKLANQFAGTVAALQGDWVTANIRSLKAPNEETVLAIVEQVAENGQNGYGVTDEIRNILVSHGYSAQAVDAIVKKAHQRSVSATRHTLEIPPGFFNANNTLYFLDREIKMNQRYNAPFSTVLISYETVIDVRSSKAVILTPDINIQLTNQMLKMLKELHKRDLDIIGVHAVNGAGIPFLILPMTDLTGALYVKKRLDKDIAARQFQVDGVAVDVEPKVTVSDYHRKSAPDRDSYLKAIYRKHCEPNLH